MGSNLLHAARGMPQSLLKWLNAARSAGLQTCRSTLHACMHVGLQPPACPWAGLSRLLAPLPHLTLRAVHSHLTSPHAPHACMHGATCVPLAPLLP